MKVNSIQSPSAAVMTSGVKVKAGPTATEWTPDTEAAAATAVVVADDDEP